ncbi:hypothetical protein B0T25DRAFT_103196 [Lasiosphaeria hispida]|uniref:SRR1-like domain-containing protein n=1 Tax=Lasiosphaeria hispida TaxID=260671 RepID=A0AAJ0HQW2_9PEZI|nr:hypothetical protein B0T25DRAFT_103196 [Lasiosphaeria hispida]
MAARQEVCQVPAEAEASNVADAMEGNKPDEEPTVKEELENDSGAQDSHGDDCPCLDDNNEGPPIKKDYTPEALHAQFLIRKAEYQKSDCHKRMADLLKSKTPPAGWAITKAMAFGLGSFSNICPCGDPTMHSERSLNQLAAFLTIVEQIQEKNRFTVKMFAQDPEFNSSEKMFLKNLGFQVIEDLNGQPMVDGKTFTYCPFLPNCVWPDIICQRQAPALYITDQQQAAIDAIWIDTERAGDIL